jgi:hypothetical protein
VQSIESQLTFRSNMSPPSSRLKNKTSRKQLWEPEPLFHNRIITKFLFHITSSVLFGKQRWWWQFLSE